MRMKTKQIILDESGIPFTEEEYQRTLEDDLFLLEMIKRDNLELKPDSRLYKLGKELGMF